MGRLENFYYNARFVLMGHILNPLWWPRSKRRDRREYYNYLKNNALLSKYIPYIESLKLDKAEDDEDSEDKIYTIWLQGEEDAPKLVKSCIENLRERYGLRYVVLDSEHLFKLIELPDYIMEKWREGKIKAAHFSDICRVELLYQYGGIWCDATDYVTSEFPEWIENANFFVYLAGDIFPYSFIQNCFIRAKRKNPLLGAWRALIHEYWRNEDKPFDYFMVQNLFRYLVSYNPDAKRLYEEMPHISQNPTHVLWYKYAGSPYSDELYERATEGTFFQKTTYKDSRAENPVEGTVADYIVNRKIPV